MSCQMSTDGGWEYGRNFGQCHGGANTQMAIGLLFAILAALCGVAISRVLRTPLSLAPLSGLATVAVLTTWTTALGLPTVVRTGCVVAIALGGAAVIVESAPRLLASWRAVRVPAALMVIAVTIPALMLGLAFAGVAAPVSTHDGAFQVEA